MYNVQNCEGCVCNCCCSFSENHMEYDYKFHVQAICINLGDKVCYRLNAGTDEL
jgi:hypothetical protein